MRILRTRILMLAVFPAVYSQQPPGVKPGALLSMATEQLGQLLAGKPMLASLPPAAAQTTVIGCQYASTRPGSSARELRFYWYEAAPAWLASVPKTNPIHEVMHGAASQCPVSLVATAATPVATPPSPTPRPTPLAPKPVAPSPVVETTPSPTSTPAPKGFNVTGLHNDDLLNKIFAGDFVNIAIDRDDTNFRVMFAQYLNAYGTRCAANLPANKVEMTRQVCTREQYSVNRYGTQVGPSTCIDWRTEGTGIYADPVMWNAKLKLDQLGAANVMKDAFKMMTQKDPINSALSMVGNMQAATNDMQNLLQMNACTSPALKRFETNLLQFAQGKQGVALAGTGSTPPAPSGPFKDSNYTRFLEDLVFENSKSWAMNRYARGSMSNVTVTTRDSAGRPLKIVGRYRFQGFSGPSDGSVTLSFSDGVPECLYFFDFPATCKSPNRRLAAAYANGGYQN